MGCRSPPSVIASITTTSSSITSSSSSSIACSVSAPHHLYRLPSCRRSTNLFVVTLILSTLFTDFLSLAIALPSGGGPSYGRYIERERASPSGRKTNQVVRHYKLHNRCSGHHVSIVGRHVDALAPIRNQNARLRFETVSFGSRVRIQSEISREFLCFNKRGQLIVRWEGATSRCVFHEVHAANGFTEFRSAANSSWFIGFGRNGRRLPGFFSPVGTMVPPTNDRQLRRQRDSDNMRPPSDVIDDEYTPTVTSRFLLSDDGGDSSATAKAAGQVAAIRRCYQFTKTDFPYINDQGVSVDVDSNVFQNSDEDITGEGSSIRRPADGSAPTTVPGPGPGGRSYGDDGWAPRIDYRYWFDRQKLNRQTTSHVRKHNNDRQRTQGQVQLLPSEQQDQQPRRKQQQQQQQRARTS